MASTQNSNSESTTTQAYQQHRQDIDRLMEWLADGLEQHRTSAEANPRSWGYVGDLEYIRKQLIESLTFVTSYQSHHIEERLRDGR